MNLWKYFHHLCTSRSVVLLLRMLWGLLLSGRQQLSCKLQKNAAFSILSLAFLNPSLNFARFALARATSSNAANVAVPIGDIVGTVGSCFLVLSKPPPTEEVVSLAVAHCAHDMHKKALSSSTVPDGCIYCFCVIDLDLVGLQFSRFLDLFPNFVNY